MKEVFDMLKVIIFLCLASAHECTNETAIARYTLQVEAATPMGCILTGYQELAKMSSFDPATQTAIVSCRR